jgi:hypothetical protein
MRRRGGELVVGAWDQFTQKYRVVALKNSMIDLILLIDLSLLIGCELTFVGIIQNNGSLQIQS